MTAEHIARTRHDRVIGAEVLQRDIVCRRFTARAGLLDHARVRISAELFGGVLRVGNIHDQQIDLAGIDAFLIPDGIGCFQDQV